MLSVQLSSNTATSRCTKVSMRYRIAFVLIYLFNHLSWKINSFQIKNLNSYHFRRYSVLPRITLLSAHSTGTGNARRKFQLKRIAQSIERLLSYQKTPFDDERGRLLVEILFSLAQASTRQESMEVGHQLHAIPLVHPNVAPSTSEQAILGRVIRAAALSGLNDLAWNYTVTGFLNWDMIPDTKAQDALSTALRRSGETERFEEFLTRAGEIATSKGNLDGLRRHVVSLTSFNMFLATLCEEKYPLWQKNKRVRSDTGALLNQAILWLSKDYARVRLGIIPDAVSYSTVLHAAASFNQTVADAVWTSMLMQEIEPDVFAYNARLRAILLAQRSYHSDQDALFLWDNQISRNDTLIPDQYTLDLIIPPLLRAGRIGDVEDLLDRFVSENSEYIVSNAFAAFLVSLIRDGDISSARALFEMYMAPSLSSVVAANAGEMRIVRPRTRHFNILLEGYRKEWQIHLSKKKTNEGAINTVDADTNPSSFINGAWNLFGLMKSSSFATIDPYTITTMMGLCRSPDELSDLLLEAFQNQRISCSGVVARAAISAFGSLCDPSSACWFCFRFYGNLRLASLRTINVLMGAFAESASLKYSSKLELESSTVANRFRSLLNNSDQRRMGNFDFLDGLNPQHAALSLLDEMTRRRYLLPKPDSQTFCLVASTLQYGETNSSLAMDLFRNATDVGVTADGRFINAIFRCFADDVDAAILAWKNEIRMFCITQDLRDQKSSESRMKGKNLMAAYNGLLFVCGRAERPDIALRVVYAMKKEGLEPNELSLNCYNSGKRRRSPSKEFSSSWLTKKLKLADPYESLLYVECMKYDKNDKRRSAEKRVRIIV